MKIEDADRASAAGRLGAAAEGYRDVILGPTARAAEAKARFADLLGTATGDGTELAAAFKTAAALNRSARGVIPPPPAPAPLPADDSAVSPDAVITASGASEP